MLGLFYAVPMCVVNMWEWEMPEIMEYYFGKGRG